MTELDDKIDSEALRIYRNFCQLPRWYRWSYYFTYSFPDPISAIKVAEKIAESFEKDFGRVYADLEWKLRFKYRLILYPDN